MANKVDEKRLELQCVPKVRQKNLTLGAYLN